MLNYKDGNLPAEVHGVHLFEEAEEPDLGDGDVVELLQREASLVESLQNLAEQKANEAPSDVNVRWQHSSQMKSVSTCLKRSYLKVNTAAGYQPGTVAPSTAEGAQL